MRLTKMCYLVRGLILLTAFAPAVCFSQYTEARVLSELQAFVDQQSKELPKKLDASTTLIDVRAEHKRLIYSYRVDLKNLTSVPDRKWREAWADIMRNKITYSVCLDEAMTDAMRHGVSFQYTYETENNSTGGDPDFEFLISTCPANILQESLVEIAEQLRQKLPLIIRRSTWTDVQAAGTTLTYFYKLNIFDFSVPADALARDEMIKILCGSAQDRRLLRLGAEYVYVYRNQVDAQLAKLSFTGADCEQ